MSTSRLMTSVLSSAAVSLAACQSTIGAGDTGKGAPGPDAGSDSAPEGELTLRQNQSDEIQPSHSLACVERDEEGEPVQNRENSYYRVFDMTEAGVPGDFEVRSVQVGVESASTADGSHQPLTVRLHTLAGALQTAALEELAFAEIIVGPEEAAVLSVPVKATVPGGATLVTEIFIPSSTVGHLFFIGANDRGETAPGYLRAPAAGCGFDEPTAMADVGVGSNVHIVLTVTGAAL